LSLSQHVANNQIFEIFEKRVSKLFDGALWTSKEKYKETGVNDERIMSSQYIYTARVNERESVHVCVWRERKTMK
jgi:hypothetical protein